MATSISLPRARKLAALITLAALLSGCAGWQAVGTPYETTMSDRTLRKARVARTDGRTDTLYHVTVTADSVIGYRSEHPLALRTPIALADVSGLESRRAASRAAAVLGVGAMAALLMVAVYAMVSSEMPRIDTITF